MQISRQFCSLAKLAFIFLLGLAMVPQLFAATFRASLDRENITLGENATLSLIFQDGQPDGDPQVPPVPNLRVQYIGPSSSISIINGRQSSTFTFNYMVAATKEGEFTIPPVSVAVGGRTMISQALKLKVGKPDTTQAQANGAPFLKVVLPKTDFYVGEPVSIEIQLYATEGRLSQPPQLQADGFTIGKVIQGPQSKTHVNGREYNVLTFKVALTAVRSGNLQIGPVTMPIAVPQQQQRSRDPFEAFFGGAQYQQVNLTSELTSVNVLSIPTQNAPATFTGGIGTFNWQVEAAPTQVSVGDPITLKIRVEGRGNIEALTFSAQPNWREFKIYPGNSHVDVVDQLGIEGTKIFEQVISPLNAGVKEIPSFSLSFFDPEQKTFRTLTHDPIPLQVRAGAATPQPTVISANTTQTETPQQTQEIVHIKPTLGTLHTAETPLIARPVFIATQALAPLLWIGAMVYRRQKEKFENNPRLQRQLAVQKIISEGLEKLKTQAAANQSDEFFATLFHLLQEQIGERLDVSASGITESVLDNELKSLGLNPETMVLLRELFDLCNQARYAPVRGSQQLAALVSKTEKALTELKKLKNESALA